MAEWAWPIAELITQKIKIKTFPIFLPVWLLGIPIGFRITLRSTKKGAASGGQHHDRHGRDFTSHSPP